MESQKTSSSLRSKKLSHSTYSEAEPSKKIELTKNWSKKSKSKTTEQNITHLNNKLNVLLANHFSTSRSNYFKDLKSCSIKSKFPSSKLLKEILSQSLLKHNIPSFRFLLPISTKNAYLFYIKLSLCGQDPDTQEVPSFQF